MIIEAKNASKCYGTKTSRIEVLRNIDLTIADGDFVVILGASGSGKSTLLNILSGLEQPDEGAIFYDGQNITQLSDDERTAFRRDTIGFIFQQYYLLPNLTVAQNVKMGADLAHNKAYTSEIEAVGLTGKQDKYPNELSGGEQQRVSIARALAKKPRVLFLDEPTGALDEKTGRQILHCITQVQASYPCTIIMVTHNQNIAEMAHTVIKMNSGMISERYQNNTRKTADEIGW